MNLSDIKVFPALLVYKLQAVPDRWDPETGEPVKYDSQANWQQNSQRVWGAWRIGDDRVLEVGVQIKSAPDFCGGFIAHSTRVHVWRCANKWDRHIGMAGMMLAVGDEPKPDDNGIPVDKLGMTDLTELYPEYDWEQGAEGFGFATLAQFVATHCVRTGARGVQGTDTDYGATSKLFDALSTRVYNVAPYFEMQCLYPWKYPEKLHDLNAEFRNGHHCWIGNRNRAEAWVRTASSTDGYYQFPIDFKVGTSCEYTNRNSGNEVYLYWAVASEWPNEWREDEYVICPECGCEAWMGYEDEYECDCGWHDPCNPELPDRVRIDKRLLPPLDNDNYLRAAPCYYWRNG